MSWRWQLEDEDGSVLDLTDEPTGGFPSRADAESWLGETWRTLAERGVEAVRLFEEDREVYGPMSLDAP